MAENSPATPTAPRLSIRIVFGEEAMLGPGKANLLERIRERDPSPPPDGTMAMSYKRAWMLVEEMNRRVPRTAGGTRPGAGRTEAARG